MPYYTALENVAFPLSFRGMPARKRNALAREALKTMGLETHLKHKPSQMSGGQQQRVGIARALVTDPDIVFADEPTGNLDSNTSDDVMNSICDVMRARNKTLVMVTHDPHMAEFADKVIQILDGKVVSIEYNDHSNSKTKRQRLNRGKKQHEPHVKTHSGACTGADFYIYARRKRACRKQHAGSQPGGYRNTRPRRTGKRGQHHHYSQRRNDFRNAHLYSRYRHERKRRSRDA